MSKNKYRPTNTKVFGEEESLKIKIHPIENRKMIFVYGKTATVTCVDGNEYKMTFHSGEEAEESKYLTEIFPFEWELV